MSKFTLALDAGHGGADPGAVGNELQEKNLTLAICQLAQAHIKKHYPNINCLLTRNSDATTTLRSRTTFATSNKADALISVHINSAENANANGFETFVFTTPGEKSVLLQQKLHAPLARLWTSKGRADRGQKRANFHMVREFKGTAVLVEFGFIVNKQDSDLLKSGAFLLTNAETLADAAAAYFGVTKSVTTTEKQQEKTDTNTLYRVLVDDKQIGAYANPDNILTNVAAAVKSGSNAILIQKVR